MRVTEISGTRLRDLRGKRSREVVAHEMRQRGHATDAKAVWRWETSRSQPSARILPDLAEVLGADSVDELYAADEDEEAAPPMEFGAAMQSMFDRSVQAAVRQQLEVLTRERVITQ